MRGAKVQLETLKLFCLAGQDTSSHTRYGWQRPAVVAVPFNSKVGVSPKKFPTGGINTAGYAWTKRMTALQFSIMGFPIFAYTIWTPETSKMYLPLTINLSLLPSRMGLNQGASGCYVDLGPVIVLSQLYEVFLSCSHDTVLSI